MARPRKLIAVSTGNISKAEIAKRQKEEEVLHDFEPVSQEPPEWLSEKAKAEYHRVIPLMDRLPIAALDEASIALYCDYYSMYIEASQSVEREGRTITEIDSQGNDKRRVNPEFTTMMDTARMVRAFAGNIGLTIDSRMRIVVPKTDRAKDPFAEMFEDM